MTSSRMNLPRLSKLSTHYVLRLCWYPNLGPVVLLCSNLDYAIENKNENRECVVPENLHGAKILIRRVWVLQSFVAGCNFTLIGRNCFFVCWLSGWFDSVEAFQVWKYISLFAIKFVMLEFFLGLALYEDYSKTSFFRNVGIAPSSRVVEGPQHN